MKNLFVILALLFIPVFCLADTNNARAAVLEKRIVFVSTRDNRDIYIMNMDGSSQTRLTSQPDYFAFDDPRVSPDNKLILATGIPYSESGEEKESDLYLLKPDGSGLRRITNGTWVKKQSCWFPSGEKIVYSSNRLGRFSLVLLDVKTGYELTLLSGEFDDMSPEVSPDGKYIVFESDKPEVNQELGEDYNEDEAAESDSDVPDGRYIQYTNDEYPKIYISDADGKNRKRLTNDYGRQGTPFWSSDSKKIFYYKYSDGSPVMLMKMDPDGKNKEQVAEFDEYSQPGKPVWLEDGTFALFSLAADGRPRRQICIIDDNFRTDSFITPVTETEDYSPQVLSAPLHKKGFFKKLLDTITGKGSKIVFATSRDTGLNIYIMNSDGTCQTKLTDTGMADSPSLSHDRKKIAYCDYVEKNKRSESRIFVMNSDGTGKHAIEAGPKFRSSPKFSPDGRRIVFTGYNEGGKNDIYIINEDGSNLKQLTSDNYYDNVPSWSPDGKKIVFASTRGPNGKICVIDADGKNLKQLTKGPDSENDDTPCWSPDGKKILFSRNYQLMTIKPDGTNAREIGSEMIGWEAVWSPDGRKIAFRPYSSNEGVYVINADGTKPIDLTNSASMNIQPSWQ